MNHIQNLCWTVERLIGRLRKRGGKTIGPPSLQSSDVESSPASGSRIFFDLTNTFRREAVGGISRVCRMFAHECRRSGDAIVVVLQDGELHEFGGSGLGRKIDPAPGDILLIIDCFWYPSDEYVDFIDKHRAAGLVAATCFYDVIPAIYPNLLPSSISNGFLKAIPVMLAKSDICLSVSQSSLDDLKSCAAKALAAEQMPQFDKFALGADFSKDPARNDGTFDDVYHEHPLFLSVGTIEPKKGYALSLDAADRLWDAGYDFNFMIIGRYGWHSIAVADRIKRHPRLGSNLFWQPHASDAFLDQAYRNTYCYVQASVAEGFGIPIIEAAGFSLPVICSDIDVFKEIGGNDLIYFESESVDSLTDAMREVLDTRPAASPIAAPSWNEAFVSLCQTLRAAAPKTSARRQALR